MQLSLNEFAVTVLRLFIWLVLLMALFIPLERWFGARHAPRPRCERLRDLGYYVISSLVPIVLLSAPTALQPTAPNTIRTVLTTRTIHARRDGR